MAISAGIVGKLMQDASGDLLNYTTPLPARIIHSLNELNRQFLDLVCRRAKCAQDAGCLGLPAELRDIFAQLEHEQRAALSGCPYALFDMRFADEAHWQTRLLRTHDWCVADGARADAEAADFSQLALFYSWHLATTCPLSAPLVLGMSERTLTAFAGLTVDRLPALIGSGRLALTARWSQCQSYWRALAYGARSPKSADFRRAQLFGLQLAATTRLSL
jgi:hypothetical protein